MLRAMGYNPRPEHIFDHPYFQVNHLFWRDYIYLYLCSSQL